MGWVSLLITILKIGSTIASYLKDKQMLDAGSALAVTKGLDDALAFLDNAKQGANGIVNNGDPQWVNSVRDKYRRK